MAFEKGKSGNPSGRPAESPKEKIIKRLTKETWNDLSQKMMTCTEEELKKIIKDKDLIFEEKLFITHMLALGEIPDWNQYTKYLERRIGKVVDELEIKLPKPTIVEFSNGDKIVMGSKIEGDDNGEK